MGLATLIIGVAAAVSGARFPLPLLMVALGTTIALIAGTLLMPVLMAAIGLDECVIPVRGC